MNSYSVGADHIGVMTQVDLPIHYIGCEAPDRFVDLYSGKYIVKLIIRVRFVSD